MRVGTAALIVATGVALDLATKAWARVSLEPYGPASDFLPFVSLHLTFNKGVSFSLLAFEGDTSQAALAYLPQTRERLPVQERLAPTRHRDARHVRWGRSPGQIGPPNLFYDPENPLESTRIEKALRRHCVAGASRAIRVTMAGEFDLHLGCQNQISRTTCAHALLLPDLIRQSTATP